MYSGSRPRGLGRVGEPTWGTRTHRRPTVSFRYTVEVRPGSGHRIRFRAGVTTRKGFYPCSTVRTKQNLLTLKVKGSAIHSDGKCQGFLHRGGRVTVRVDRLYGTGSSSCREEGWATGPGQCRGEVCTVGPSPLPSSTTRLLGLW